MKLEFKTIFYDKIKSYILTAVFGIIAGLLVAFFSTFPEDDLWAFSYFSSETFGFWMFTTSFIVLFSEKRKTALINSTIYVGLMFALTAISKMITDYQIQFSQGSLEDFFFINNYNSFSDYIFKSSFYVILYSIPSAIVCGVLGAILWNGRKNTKFGKLLLVAPAIYILFEAVFMYYKLFTMHTMLFMAIINTVCLLLYILIFSKYFLIKKAS